MYTKEELPDNTEFGYYDGAGLDPGVGGAPNSLPGIPFPGVRGLGGADLDIAGVTMPVWAWLAVAGGAVWMWRRGRRR